MGRKPEWPQEAVDYLKATYHEHGYRATAEKFGYSMKYVLTKAGHLKLKSTYHRGRPTALRWDYFEQWTPNSAYLLGYVWADGCITGQTLRLACAEEDSAVIHFARKELNSHHKVTRYERPGYKPMVRLVVCSARLSRSLRQVLQVPMRKSHINPAYPHVPDETIGHFARGLLDGDGCVQVRNGNPQISFGAGPAFIEGFREQLRRVCGVEPPTVVQSPSPMLSSIVYARREWVERLAALMYPTEDLFCLQRKKDKLFGGLRNEVVKKVKWPASVGPEELKALLAECRTQRNVARKLGVSQNSVFEHVRQFGLQGQVPITTEQLIRRGQLRGPVLTTPVVGQGI